MKLTQVEGRETMEPTDPPGNASPVVTSTKVQVRNKSHPRRKFYNNACCYEILKESFSLLRKYPSLLTDVEAGTVVGDPERLSGFWEEIHEGDLVGLGTWVPGQGWLNRLLLVKRKSSSKKKTRTKKGPVNPGTLRCKLVDSRGEPEEGQVTVTGAQISVGLEAGFAEILYRDGRPYGIDEYTTWTVNMHGLPVSGEQQEEEEEEPEEGTNT
jgi:hypothetical protein